MRTLLISAARFLTALFVAQPIAAQQSNTGVVQITVQESMGMVEGFMIRSAGRSTVTDSAGKARLTLPVGSQVLSITRSGFAPKRVTVTVVADSVVTVISSV